MDDTSLAAPQAALIAAAADHATRFDDVTGWIEDVPAWLSAHWEQLLLVAGALALVIVLLFRLARAAAARSAPTHEALARCDAGVSRRLSRLKMTVADFEGGTEGELLGADAAAVFRRALEAPSHTRADFSVNYAPSADPSDLRTFDELGKVLAQTPHGALVAAVMQLLASLFAPHSATVRGRLLPADDRGVGISVSVVTSGGPGASMLLREDDFDPRPGGALADRWGRLIAPAVVWLRHELQPMIDKREQKTSWKAEALDVAGRQWAATGDLLRAASCFRQAIEEDERLLPVYNNLAVTRMQLGSYGRALKLLDQLRRALNHDPNAEIRWPALRANLRYNRALALRYEALEDDSGAKLTRALVRTRRLLEEILMELQSPAAPTQQASAKENRKRLELIEPAVRLLFASLLVCTSQEEAASALRSAAGERPPEKEALLSHEQKLELVRGVGDTDKAARLVDDCVCRKTALSPRAHYNLACYYTTVLESVSDDASAPPDARERVRERARRHLGFSLEARGLREWAQRDPSLAPLRAETRSWEALIEHWSPQPHEAEVATPLA